MLAMFLGASIPMMEKRSLERRPQYQSVIDSVPRLVPRPPAGPPVTRRRVVIAGLGDSGVLTAMRLARSADVVGISAQPALVSGQELGCGWPVPGRGRDYLVPFDRYRALDRVRTVQATLTGVDLAAREVHAQLPDGSRTVEPYDSLVISTGVRNGFWRRAVMQSPAAIRAEITAAHDRLAEAGSIMVIGGGAAAVSAAANLAAEWPDKAVDLYFPHDRPLREHPPHLGAPAAQADPARCGSASVPSRAGAGGFRV